MLARTLLAGLSLAALARATPISNETAIDLDKRAKPLGYVFDLSWSSAAVCKVSDKKFDIFHRFITSVTTNMMIKVPIDTAQRPTCVRGDCEKIDLLDGDEDARGTNPPGKAYISMPIADFTPKVTGRSYAGCCTIDFSIGFYLDPVHGFGVGDPEKPGKFWAVCHAGGKSLDGKDCYDVLGRPAEDHVYIMPDDCIQTRAKLPVIHALACSIAAPYGPVSFASRATVAFRAPAKPLPHLVSPAPARHRKAEQRCFEATLTSGEAPLQVRDGDTPLGHIFNLKWTGVGLCHAPGNKYSILDLRVGAWVSTDVTFKVPADEKQRPTCMSGSCEHVTYTPAARKPPPSPGFYSLPLIDHTAKFDGGNYAGCCSMDYALDLFLNPHNGKSVVDPEAPGTFFGYCHTDGTSTDNGQSCYDVLDKPTQPFIRFDKCYKTGLRPSITATPYYDFAMLSSSLLTIAAYTLAIRASVISQQATASPSQIDKTEEERPDGYLFTIRYTSAGYCSLNQRDRKDVHRVNSRVLQEITVKAPEDWHETPSCIDGPCDTVDVMGSYDKSTAAWAVNILDRSIVYDSAGGDYAGCCQLYYGTDLHLNPHNGGGWRDDKIAGFWGYCDTKGTSGSGQSCKDVLPFGTTFLRNCIEVWTAGYSIESKPYWNSATH
ncbi:uncharacterized protein L969DRAFT_51205 [Mixia osmundae IAM 14324]|uniref:Uncharacterized protein n=1 Tax=Mixia osmundae (strain CBS 9802 / IAM 14324 / JCM 22182 / KY 12970) TaxID=764103 RepID=G7E7G2_MIXOS|nr:uncharacterized protein L969DRAFT_51205 [Mixia osmundae IAM 14324]KEI38375.1 hypothetical protein L969DRAFT_51205 [Mixia osmundae IAM 14324]GAA98772.1 hypothetical protein E5Q_05460 [Mixia osmundae IAM 14324]